MEIYYFNFLGLTKNRKYINNIQGIICWRLQMNKKVIITLICLLLIPIYFLGADEKLNLWNSIINEQNSEARFQLLKEYDSKFGQVTDKNTKYLYLNLTFTSIQLEKYNETISYGEKALIFKDDIKDINKLKLYLFLANAYYLSKIDFDKAYQSAESLITLSKKMKNDGNVSINLDRKFIAPALRIQTKALYEKDKDNPEEIKKAINKVLEAYKYDQSRNTSQLIYKFSLNLFQKKMYNEAIQALEQILDEDNPNLKHLDRLAKCYDKIGNKARAVEYLEELYKIKKKAKTAYSIGALLQKRNIDKAIKYLAEAYQLQEGKYSLKAHKLLEHLYFIIKAKNKSNEEKEKEFKQILEAAKARIRSELS